MNVAVVIPTYNEKESLSSLIENLFEKVKDVVDELHVVIVDDSSPDGTSDIARKLGERFKNISVIQRPSKMGLGTAYKDGFNLTTKRNAWGSQINSFSSIAYPMTQMALGRIPGGVFYGIDTVHFAAGAMIFVVVEEVVPESQQSKYTDVSTLGFIGGFMVMMTLDVGLG